MVNMSKSTVIEVKVFFDYRCKGTTFYMWIPNSIGV